MYYLIRFTFLILVTLLTSYALYLILKLGYDIGYISARDDARFTIIRSDLSSVTKKQCWHELMYPKKGRN